MSENQEMSAYSFLYKTRRITFSDDLPSISLFSGAGISDLGYEQVGFQFLVHSELRPNRSALCESNYPNSTCVTGDLRERWKDVISGYKKQVKENPALISITPPCQGMSSSNPSRGKCVDADTSDERNMLLLASIPIIKELRPRLVVIENVPQVFQRVVQVREDEKPCKLVEKFTQSLDWEYRFFSTTVQMADYGVPQDRRRAIIVAIRKDEGCIEELDKCNLLPLPCSTHSERTQNGQSSWITFEEWLLQMNYPPLDAKSANLARYESDPLHSVPYYKEDRYLMVSDIPPRSGRNAYQNSNCHECGCNDVPEGEVTCPKCNGLMRNRPYVKDENGEYRLIKGFKSSYRRSYHDRPAPTVTTASSHLGSDYKIHPWENRVLSIRECADLQTIPRFYNWQWAIESEQLYLMRKVIGEALPPLFTFFHANVLCDLLKGIVNSDNLLISKKS